MAKKDVKKKSGHSFATRLLAILMTVLVSSGTLVFLVYLILNLFG